MFNSKNNIAWKNGIKHVIADTDETKKYIEYIDGVRESMNIKAVTKLFGYLIRYFIEDNIKYIIAILLSIALIITSNNEILTNIGIAALITTVMYKIGTVILFKNSKKVIMNYVNETADVNLTEKSFEKPDAELVMYARKTYGGKSKWLTKWVELCYEALKAVEYMDEFKGIAKFIINDCNQYVKEVLTNEDFEDFVCSIYSNKEFYESLFSASKSDIPSYFHYYTIAEICIKMINREGWFDSIEKFDEFIDRENNIWYWISDMKSAFESRDTDKGDSLYKLTVIGMLLRAKREIEASLKKD